MFVGYIQRIFNFVRGIFLIVSFGARRNKLHFIHVRAMRGAKVRKPIWQLRNDFSFLSFLTAAPTSRRTSKNAGIKTTNQRDRVRNMEAHRKSCFETLRHKNACSIDELKSRLRKVQSEMSARFFFLYVFFSFGCFFCSRFAALRPRHEGQTRQDIER